MKVLAIALLLLGATLAGCASPTDSSGSPRVTFQQAGSSTVLPVAQAWAEEFPKVNGSVSFVVGGGGTGAGFKQFCRGEIHVADASRPIKDAEKADCEKAGVQPFEVQVAIDALAVVVSRKNTFAQDITTEELYRIWTANASQVDKWSDLRPEWPDEKILLYGPGTDSGTFDYFIEVIIHPKDGSAAKGRSDFTKSEDDNVLVQGVEANPYALGYFGLAYVGENAERIRALPVDGGKGDGAKEPTAANVEAGTYTPLARPIFMYTDGKPTGPLQQYFLWGLGNEGQALVEEAGYIKLPAARQAEMLAKLR